MFEIGNSLREARVRQGLDYSQVELATMIRAKYLVDAVPFSKVKGRPFQIREIVRKVEEYL